MKNPLKGLSLLVIGLLLGAQAAAQNAPDWYNSGELPNYPKETYLTGIGAADNQDAARNNASKDIAEQIRVNIQGTTQSIQKEVVTDEGSSFKEMFKNAVSSSVNETVSGIEYVKQAESGGTYYVFATLDKSKYLNSLEGKLQKQENSINTLVTEGQGALEQGKIIVAIDNFSSATEQIPKFYADKAIYDALSEMPYRLENQFSVSDIESELRTILSNLEIEVTSGNRQSAQAGEPLPEPIEFLLRYSYRGEDIPLSGVTIKASYKDGATIDRVPTNQQGKASILGEAVPPSYGDRGEIILEPVLSNLPYGFRNYTQNASTSVIYNVSDQMPLMMSIDIRDKDKNSLRRVNDKVARSLERLGHTITEDAPLTLEGTVEVIEVSEVETMGKTQILVRAELSVQMKVDATGEVIGTFATVEEGLSTRGEKAAMESAYNRMKIDRRTFSDFVARSENKLSSVFGDKSKENLEKGKQLMEQEKYQAAVEQLKLVTYGQEYVREARELMRDALSHLNANRSGSGGMAGYSTQNLIAFDQHNEGDFLKQYGDKVVVKGGGQQEKYASVFEERGTFSVDLPQGKNEVAVEIRAKVANDAPFNQRFGIKGDGYNAFMTFNEGYYRKATFGSTTKDIDREGDLNWDNYGSNTIRFVIEDKAVKTFINNQFFGARELKSTSGAKQLVLELSQNDAIYGVTVGSK